MAAASEPADREELKNSPFSKGEWPVAFDIDVGYDRLRELLQSGEDEGFMSLTSKHLLAIAYSAGQHELLLGSDPETTVQRWETELDARSLRLPVRLHNNTNKTHDIEVNADETHSAILTTLTEPTRTGRGQHQLSSDQTARHRHH